MTTWLRLLALSRTLPPRRELRVVRGLGEDLALSRPFDLALSRALDRVVQLQELEDAADDERAAAQRVR